MQKCDNKSVKVLKLIALIFAWFSVSAAAQTTVYFNFSDPQYGLSQTTNRTVVLQAESGTSVSGGSVLLPFKITTTTDVNGYCAFTNLFGSQIAGYYHITLPAPPQRADFDIWVSSTNLGYVNGNTLLGVFGASTYPAAVFAWGAQVSDNRYGPSTNSATNFVTFAYLNTVSNSLVSSIQSQGAANTNFTLVTSNALAAIIATNTTGTTAAQVTNIVNQTILASNLAPYAAVTAATNATLAYVTNTVNTTSNSLQVGFLGTVNTTSNILAAQAAAALVATNGQIISYVSGTYATTAALILTNFQNLQVDTNLIAALSNNVVPYTTGVSNIVVNNQAFAAGVSNTVATVSNTVAANALTQIQGTNTALTAALIATNISIISYVNTTVAGATNFGPVYSAINNASNTVAANSLSQLVSSNAAQSAALVATNGQIISYVQSYTGTQIANATNGISATITLTSNALQTQAFSISNSLLGTINTASNANSAYSLAISNNDVATLGFAKGVSNSLVGGTNTLTAWTLAQFVATNAPIAATNALNLNNASNYLLVVINASNALQTTAQGVLSNATFNALSLSNILIQSAASNTALAMVTGTNAALTNLYYFGTNWLNTNLLAQIGNTNYANLVLTSNLITSASNGLINLSSNYFVSATNYAATRGTNWDTYTTNLIGINNGGSGAINGTYLNSNAGNIWTNVNNTNCQVLLSGSTFYAQSNSISLYSWTAIPGTVTVVSGAFPVPSVYYGRQVNLNGQLFVGWANWFTNIVGTGGGSSTNGLATIGFVTNYVQTATNGLGAVPTNGALYGTVYVYGQGWQGYTNGVGPTNGFPTNYTGVVYLPGQTNINGGAILAGTVGSNQIGFVNLSQVYPAPSGGTGITTNYSGVVSLLNRTNSFAGNGITFSSASIDSGNLYSNIYGGSLVTLGTSVTEGGNNTTPPNSYAHSEGVYNTASGTESHVGGNNSTASGYGSYAYGNYVLASGSYGFAIGNYTIAQGVDSFAGGSSVISSNNSFAWSDGSLTPYPNHAASPSTNTFYVVASNGVYMAGANVGPFVNGTNLFALASAGGGGVSNVQLQNGTNAAIGATIATNNLLLTALANGTNAALGGALNALANSVVVTNALLATNGNGQFLTGIRFTNLVGYVGSIITVSTNYIWVVGAGNAFANGQYVFNQDSGSAYIWTNTVNSSTVSWGYYGATKYNWALQANGTTAYTNLWAPTLTGSDFQKFLGSITLPWSANFYLSTGTNPPPLVFFGQTTYAVSQVGGTYYTNIVTTNGLNFGTFAGSFNGAYAGSGAGLTNIPAAAISTNGSVANAVLTSTNGLAVWMPAQTGSGFLPSANQTNVLNFGVTNNNALAVNLATNLNVGGDLTATNGLLVGPNGNFSVTRTGAITFDNGNAGSDGNGNLSGLSYNGTGNPSISAFNGNGSGLTGLTPAQVGAVPTNGFADYYGDTNALNFAKLAGITDLVAIQHLQAFENELRKGGVYSNLVEALPLETWLNPASNSPSWFGRTMVMSNVVQGLRGADFNNSLLKVDFLPNCRTNTIVITMRLLTPVADGSGQVFVGGLVNTNTSSAIWQHFWPGHYVNVYQRSGTSQQWGGGNSNLVAQLRLDGTYDYGVPQTRQGERLVLQMSSDGNGNMTAALDGLGAKINNNGYVFVQNSTVTNTDALTELRLGNDIVSAGNDAPFVGEILNVMVFNAASTSNLWAVAARASACLEPESAFTTYMFDSRGLAQTITGGTTVQSLTNSLPWFIQQRNAPGSLLWRNLSQGGTFPSQMLAASNLLFQVGMPSIITKNYLYSDEGVNAINPAYAAFNLVASTAILAAQNNVLMGYFTPWTVWTNSGAISGSIVYTTGTATNVMAMQSLAQTNASLFPAGVFYSGAFVTQNMLNTNLPPNGSYDGTHFYSTNGWVFNQMLASLPANTLPAADYDGNLPYTSGGVLGTNFPNGIPAASVSLNSLIVPTLWGSNVFSAFGTNTAYLQGNIQNAANTGAVDWVLTQDTGGPTNNYVDLFQNNSAYSASANGTLDSSNDAGITMVNTNSGATLWIQNQATNGLIRIVTTTGGTKGITNLTLYPAVAAANSSNVVAGTEYATAFVGNVGTSNLMGQINATNLGQLSITNLPGAVITNNATSLTINGTVSATTFSGNGSGITNSPGKFLIYNNSSIVIGISPGTTSYYYPSGSGGASGLGSAGGMLPAGTYWTNRVIFNYSSASILASTNIYLTLMTNSGPGTSYVQAWKSVINGPFTNNVQMYTNINMGGIVIPQNVIGVWQFTNSSATILNSCSIESDLLYQ